MSSLYGSLIPFMLLEEIVTGTTQTVSAIKMPRIRGAPQHEHIFNLETTAQLIIMLVCILLLAVITRNYNIVWIPTLLLIFLVGWQLTDGGLSQGSLEMPPFSMYLILLLYAELTVIGSLSSSPSYYISPFGYPV